MGNERGRGHTIGCVTKMQGKIGIIIAETDKTRDKDRDRERERDHGHDRDIRRGRDMERDRDRDHDRDRPCDRERDRNRDYGRASHKRDRGHMHERDGDYDQIEPTHDRERSSATDIDLEPGEHHYRIEQCDEPVKHGHGRDHDHDHNAVCYDHLQVHGLSESKHGLSESKHDRQHLKRHEPEYCYDSPYDKIQGGYRAQYEHGDPEPRNGGEAVPKHDYGYQRSE